MKDHVVLGTHTVQRGTSPVFGLSHADRRHHCYTVGRTGMGKSTLIKNAVLQDIASGAGVALIDPHGDLAEEVLDRIPEDRHDDVVYFNPADLRHPSGLNVLASPDAEEHHLVISGVLSAFKHLWRDSWGPRLEYVLSNALQTVVLEGNHSLLGVYRLLSEADFRDRLIRRVTDPVLRVFWEEEFAAYSDRFRAEVLAPVQNKLGRYLATPMLRNILGQVRSTVDIEQIMNEGRILIANLSIGRLGEDNTNLLGSLLVSQIHVATMRRAKLPENDRRDFYCYVDEFQSFGTDAFVSILSEARKYRLSLFLGHQYLEQLDPDLRQAVLGNVGTLLVFGVGARDAEILEKELPVPARSLVELGKYRIWVRLMVDGETLQPFSAETLPPTAYSTVGNRRRLVHLSRRRHASSRRSVEHRIKRWLGNQEKPVH